MKRDLGLYCDDIIAAINKIEEYTRGSSFEQFSKDQKTQDAVTRNIEIIGEAVKKIPPEFKQKYPLAMWREAAAMRDVLIHDYPDVIPKVVWDQLLFPQWVLPRALNHAKPDVVLYTNNYISMWGRYPKVVIIHDMTPFIIPSTFYWLHGFYQRSYFRISAKRSQKIITVSENSRKDICRILKVPEDKVVVVMNATSLKDHQSPDPSVLEKFNINLPFILYVGAIHPRKNIDRLIQAFDRLKMSREIPHQLVVVGRHRWGKQVSASKFLSSIIFVDSLSDAQLVVLYQSCEVFVYPSLYEGFGLPVLEAMSYGAAVVTSKASSLPEVAGDAAVLVDPYDVDNIADGIWRLISQPDLRRELREKGLRQSALFSWKRSAKKVLEILESIKCLKNNEPA